jgi:hypothetical protein
MILYFFQTISSSGEGFQVCSMSTLLKCIALLGAVQGCRADVQISIEPCITSDSFSQWAQSGGQIHSVSNASLCISGSAGSDIQVATCDSTIQQQWRFQRDGTVRSPDNATCWNVPGQSTAPGTSILAYPCGTPVNGNLIFAYEPATRNIFANQSGLCVRWNGGPLPPPQPLPAILNVTASPCFADNTGVNDSTSAIQRCIDLGYSTIPPIPVFFPTGDYIVSDTLSVIQTNPGPDDGINVCPSRFLSHVLFGSTAELPARPTIRLAPSSPGFDDPAHYKPVVRIFNSGGQGVDMNNLFRGINVDISAVGNAGAVGVSHPGAQGSTVTDVTVQVRGQIRFIPRRSTQPRSYVTLRALCGLMP